MIQVLDKSNKVVRTQMVDSKGFTIGRGYTNSLVFDDAYVDEYHAVIEQTDAGWSYNLKNPVNRGRFNGKALVADSAQPIAYDDEVMVGGTKIRFVDPYVQLPEALPLTRVEAVVDKLKAPLVLAASMVLCLVFVAINLYQNSYYEVSYSKVAMQSGVDVLFYLIWPVVVVIIAHVVRQQASLPAQIAVSFAAFNVMFIVGYIFDVLAYNFSGELVSGASTLVDIVMFFMLVWLSVRVATTYNETKRMIVTCSVFGVLFAITMVNNASNEPVFSIEPQLDTRLMPASFTAAPAQSSNDFLSQEAVDLFKPVKYEGE